MGDTTGIEWTGKTWNPWQGCTHVSAGCDNCYMFTEKRRYGQDPEKVVRSKPPTFNAPLRWKSPELVFTCSWSDFFHVDADAWRPEAWQIIKATPHLFYQVLTKRPGRMLAHLPADWGEGYANVALGTSIEDPSTEHRLAPLLMTPARVHFVSLEPLLGPVSLVRALNRAMDHPANATARRTVHPVDWAIVGGESGPNARPMDVAWARALRDECRAGGIAYFLKQLGGFPDKRGHDAAVLDGKRYLEMPEAFRPAMRVLAS